MIQRYIKVTDENGKPFVALKTNEPLYRSRKYKIEEATKEEIEKFFPEEKEKIESKTDDLKKLSDELAKEKISHDETKRLLSEANSKIESYEKKVEKQNKKDKIEEI